MKQVKLKDIKNSNIAGIYKINFPNGKSYIGQSQNIYKRICEHNRYAKKGHGQHNLQVCELAIQKYGEIEKFTILEEDIPLEKLDEREFYWIKKFDTTNKEKGYNITSGGDASGKRGINHPNALFNEEDINNIYDLLINHKELSYIDIANKYNTSQMTIYRICNGESYKNEKLKYPLRSNDHTASQKNDILDYFTSEEQLVALKDDLLYRWDLSIEEDIKEKYNIPLKILRAINHGEKFQEIGNYTYPIRAKNIRNIYNFTQEDIINILNELSNTKNSMTEIGSKYGITRKLVGHINQGTAYIIKNYNYPARKTNH